MFKRRLPPAAASPSPFSPRSPRTLVSLSPDVLVQIASFLVNSEHATIARCCKRLAEACRKPGAWTTIDTRTFNNIATIGLRCVRHIDIDADTVLLSGLTLVEQPLTVTIRNSHSNIDESFAQLLDLNASALLSPAWAILSSVPSLRHVRVDGVSLADLEVLRCLAQVDSKTVTLEIPHALSNYDQYCPHGQLSPHSLQLLQSLPLSALVLTLHSTNQMHSLVWFETLSKCKLQLVKRLRLYNLVFDNHMFRDQLVAAVARLFEGLVSLQRISIDDEFYTFLVCLPHPEQLDTFELLPTTAVLCSSPDFQARVPEATAKMKSLTSLTFSPPSNDADLQSLCLPSSLKRLECLAIEAVTPAFVRAIAKLPMLQELILRVNDRTRVIVCVKLDSSSLAAAETACVVELAKEVASGGFVALRQVAFKCSANDDTSLNLQDAVQFLRLQGVCHSRAIRCVCEPL